MGELNNAFWQQPSSSYSIEYAGRFDFDGNSYMSKSSATATDRGKFTLSYWFKIGGTPGASGNKHVFWTAGTNGANYAFLELRSNHKVFGGEMTGIAFGSSNETFQDASVWYHMVYRYDSSESSQNNRLRIYIDGSQLTGFDLSNIGSGENHPHWNVSPMYIGQKSSIGHAVNGADWVYADWIMVDGKSLAPTEFATGYGDDLAIVDPSKGSWVGSGDGNGWGNNGFWMQFAVADALGTDSSGQGHNFTPSGMGTDHRVTDTPSNPA